MVIEEMSYQMGRCVAKEILSSENKLLQLDEELEKIREMDKKQMENLNVDEFPNVKKVLKVSSYYLANYLFKYIFSTTQKKKSDKIQKNILNYGTNNKNLQSLLSVCFFERSSSKNNGSCALCTYQGFVARPPILNRFDESTSLSEEAKKSSICGKCAFYLWLSNLFPIPSLSHTNRWKLENGKTFGLEVLTNEVRVNIAAFFNDVLFESLIKYSFLKTKIFHENLDIRFVFYLDVGQNSNNNLIFISSLQSISLIYKIIEIKNKSNRKINLSRVIFTSLFSKDGDFGPKYFIEMLKFLETGRISTYVMKIVVFLIQKNRKYKWEFIEFSKFLQIYFDAKGENMNEKEKIAKWALDTGASFGRGIMGSLTDDSEKKNAAKFIKAISGTMELSANTFLDGLAKLERAYSTPLYISSNKDLEIKITDVAECEKARISFIIGLLKSVLILEQSKVSKENDQ